MSWYILHGKEGQEEKLIGACRRFLSGEVLEDVFQLSGRRMKKYLGEWHTDTFPLFPGYIFLQSSRPEALLCELEQRLLAAEVLEREGLLLPVSVREERLFRSLCGPGHVLELSRGYVRDGRFLAREGPLAGREDLIRKVDLHRRVAVLDRRVTGGVRDIWAGIEIRPGDEHFGAQAPGAGRQAERETAD